MGVPASTSAPINNAWRMLARALKIKHDTTTVDIPGLSGPLYDELTFGWNATRFMAWFNRYYAGKSVAPKAVYPEWRFNEDAAPDGKSGFTSLGRRSFLCVYYKLRAEGLWTRLVASVRWVGLTGEMLFMPSLGAEGTRKYLLGNGYGDWWMASKDSSWGVRSRFSGTQLHFRGPTKPGDPINVHIDLNNPGDPKYGAPTGGTREVFQAYKHWCNDLRDRARTHQANFLEGGLRGQGIDVPSIE